MLFSTPLSSNTNLPYTLPFPQPLQRAEWLPVYDDEGIRIILAEIEEIQQKMESVVERYGKNDVPVPVRVQVAFLFQSQIRNFRCLNR
ncbi:hypothetical protein EON63_19095 [archaeon]|nr:MAG: hypothetical protein EON63_19095 [archaeon]